MVFTSFSLNLSVFRPNFQPTGSRNLVRTFFIEMKPYKSPNALEKLDSSSTSNQTLSDEIQEDEKVIQRPRHQSQSNLVHTLAGGISGGIGSIILQPLDVIKTRQQQLFFHGTKTISQ